MSDNFYRAFEDKHRGSRELIKSRLEIYLPFIEKIKEIQPKPKTIDLGCGRGEWLELLSENDCEAQGIDLDEGMLQACTQRGFNVKRQDAIEALRNTLGR
jgi:O-antigen chain-terminating methyltransferase